ncbi:septation protein A [Sphingomonas sp. ID0503]|uniref:septation protein A n=1 Tax=Sphingomonas sp. ID0503 TaxID=3399691 RepID=UPI003AFA69CE
MTEPTPIPRELGPVTRLAIDFGPLIVFFVTNAFAPVPKITKIFAATAAFMVATAIAMGVSLAKSGKISPMLLFSGAMVLVMGGITLWLHDDTFIKIKPTIYYVFVAGILFFGLFTGRPTLELVLGSAYPGLSAPGWRLLTRNWAFFFVAMAIANEAVWRNTSTDFWVGYKLWGAIPATLIFAAANMPMLTRYGLGAEKVQETLPPQG